MSIRRAGSPARPARERTTLSPARTTTDRVTDQAIPETSSTPAIPRVSSGGGVGEQEQAHHADRARGDEHAAWRTGTVDAVLDGSQRERVERQARDAEQREPHDRVGIVRQAEVDEPAGMEPVEGLGTGADRNDRGEHHQDLVVAACEREAASEDRHRLPPPVLARRLEAVLPEPQRDQSAEGRHGRAGDDDRGAEVGRPGERRRAPPCRPPRRSAPTAPGRSAPSRRAPRHPARR